MTTKVLIPALHYPPVIGGMEVWIKNIAEGLSSEMRILLVTGKVKGQPNREEKKGVEIFRTSLFSLQNLSSSPFFYIFTALPFIFFKSLDLIKKEDIDLLHCHGFLSGLIGYFLNIFTQVPYIITIQSADFTVYHPKAKVWPIKQIHDWLERRVFKNATECHTVSSYLQDYYRKQGIKESVLIPNGVETEDFEPAEDKIKLRKELGFDTPNLLICVSRLEHKNGTHDLIKALTYLPPEIEEFKLIICGDGADREKLEKMVKDLNLQGKVVFLGPVLRSELPKYVACSDVFIRPSLAEGFGIVFLEAMACGVPVIGTPVGGIPDFLKNRKTGLFCEPGDPKDIAKKIKTLLLNKELKRGIVLRAKKTVEEKYDWSRISERIGRIYKKVKEGTGS